MGEKLNDESHGAVIHLNAVKNGETTITTSPSFINQELPATTITGTKTWADNSNAENLRPLDVTLILKADGTALDQQPVPTWKKTGDQWTYEYENLPLNNANGEKINYTVTEKLDENSKYVATYDTTNLNITNTLTDKITVSGIKTWVDNGNAENLRPSDVTLILKANGTALDQQPVPTWKKTGDQWTYEYHDLQQYDSAGKKITYSVTEKMPENTKYMATYDATNLNVTNTLTDKITVSGTKIWADNGNVENLRPSDVTLILKANGTALDQQPVPTWDKTGDQWTYTYTDLPVYINGVKQNYTVTENLPRDSKYVASYKGNNITNTLTDTISITGTKTWVDNNDAASLRPDSVSLILSANGSELKNVKASWTKDSANIWKYSYTNLAKYDSNGTVIRYTVDEELPDTSKYVPTYDKTHLNITNTLSDTINITGTKTWIDNSNSEKLRPSNVTLILKANGVALDNQPVPTWDKTGDQWSYRYDRLPVFVNGVKQKYTVDEVQAKDTKYVATYDESHLDITNTLTDTISIDGTKTWVDNSNVEKLRPSNVTLILKANGVALDNQPVPTWDKTGDQWTYTYADLPVYVNGVKQSYTISEELPKNTKYVATYDTTNLNITNTLTDKITFSGTKTWADNNNAENLRPADITLILKANGVALEKQPVPTWDKTGNQWTYAYTDLPVYVNGVKQSYTVSEDVAKDAKYVATYDTANLNITNTLTGKTTVQATKTWVDNNDQDGLRTKSVVLQLQKSVNGSDAVDVPDQTLTLSADNNWTDTLKDLDMYDENGIKIDYSFREVTKIDGYTTSYSKDGLTAINTHTPAVTTAVVTKTWDDKDNLYQVRPESVTFQLQKTVNGTTSNVEGKTVELNEKNDWTYTFEDLPKYEAGKEITYTAVETSTDKNYTSSASGLTVKNTLITGKLVIKKTFSGASISEDAKNKLSFTITGPNNYSKTVTYAEFTNGEYDLDYLLAGEYTVTETNNVVDSFRNNTTYSVNGASGHVATVDAKNTPVFQIQNTYISTPKTPGDQPKRPTTPNTGDRTNLPLSAAGMMCSCLAVMMILFLKKKYIA